MAQITIDSSFYPILSILIIPVFLYFIKLEIRVRKIEELERTFGIETRLKNLETHPFLQATQEMTVQDAINMYNKAKVDSNESS